jgi:3-oxoacyl-[acyl-carrier protein] reductase
MTGQVHYAAAKAGLIGATKSLARECAKKNVLVNAVTPGFIATDMTEDINEKELKKTVPMNRFGKPEEVASVVSFLASDDAGYITGQVLGVNGGAYM